MLLSTLKKIFHRKKMFKKKYILKSFLIFWLVIIFADGFSIQDVSHQSLMEQANKNYLDKKYDDAIVQYEQLVSEGYESTELFYNLGNSYYKINKPGFAVLNYERALKLSPSDEDIVHNIALVNSRLVDKVESLPEFFLFSWWEYLLSLFSLSGWSYAAYIFLLLVISFVVFYFFAGSSIQQKISVIGGGLSLIILLLVISLLVVKLNREVNIKSGIIIEQVVTAKLEPDEKSNDAFIIHEGLKVKVEDKVEQWYKIRLQDGKVGWLQGNAFKII